MKKKKKPFISEARQKNVARLLGYFYFSDEEKTLEICDEAASAKWDPRYKPMIDDLIARMKKAADTSQTVETYDAIKAEYGLFDDPFTRFPCSAGEYAKASEEYNRQLMEEKFGYYPD